MENKKQYVVREATEEMLAAACVVEKDTMGDYCYLQDAWQTFKMAQGALLCAYDGDTMAGIGRFTVLPDGSGWLETLRVRPSYKRQGVGRAIYGGYLAQAEKYHCPAMGMFTGITNEASAGLAAVHGMHIACHHHGFGLADVHGGARHGFVPVNWQRAEELVLSQKDAYNNYVSLNRTFYRINQENARAFGAAGWVYEDAQSGSFIVCGARFQPFKTLHIAMMHGDVNACIDFAMQLAEAQNVPSLTCTLSQPNEAGEAALLARGFVQHPGEIITMERVF